MDNKTYRARIADKLLAEKLDAMGAVLIEGANLSMSTMMSSFSILEPRQSFT